MKPVMVPVPKRHSIISAESLSLKERSEYMRKLQAARQAYEAKKLQKDEK